MTQEEFLQYNPDKRKTFEEAAKMADEKKKTILNQQVCKIL